jgi:4,5-DOPA dioxygenase extradiol
MTAKMPAVFLSHGSPLLTLEQGPARDFLDSLQDILPRPKAILAVSAHWETHDPAVSLAKEPETIHDFYGFPKALYEQLYPAPGAPEMAERAAGLLEEAGFQVTRDLTRGFDHGAWMPLYLGLPKAEIPMAQLSIQPEKDPAYHAKLGEALKPLREEGVLILATGAMTHNLREIDRHDIRGATPGWAEAFADWMAEKTAAGDREALLSYRRQAPEAARAHPTDEHLLPFYVALGAGDSAKGRVLHRSFTYGSIAMDAYAFD